MKQEDKSRYAQHGNVLSRMTRESNLYLLVGCLGHFSLYILIPLNTVLYKKGRRKYLLYAYANYYPDPAEQIHILISPFYRLGSCNCLSKNLCPSPEFTRARPCVPYSLLCISKVLILWPPAYFYKACEPRILFCKEHLKSVH